MLKQVRMAAGNERMILTESNAEPFMNGINIYLTLVAFNDNLLGDRKSIPIFANVYSGYYIAAGAEFYQSDLINPKVFASKLAYQYVYGAQMGWFALGNGSDNMGLFDLLMEGRFEEEVNFLKTLSSHKYMNRKWMHFGRRINDLPNK
jgi:hypothetical protein